MQITQSEISYHKKIDELPLSKFIDCIVDNNLASLVIGTFPEQYSLPDLLPALENAWQNIKSEYAERIGTGEYKLYVNLFKQITLLRITLDQINALAAREVREDGIVKMPWGILRLCYDPELANELNKILKTSFLFNCKDLKTYHGELDKCINRSKAFKIQLDLKLINFDAIEKKNAAKGKTKLDRAYFASMLVTLSDFAKYEIRDDIKMGQYCERLKRFNEVCEKSSR